MQLRARPGGKPSEDDLDDNPLLPMTTLDFKLAHDSTQRSPCRRCALGMSIAVLAMYLLFWPTFWFGLSLWVGHGPHPSSCPQADFGIGSNSSSFTDRRGPRVLLYSGAYSNIVDGVSLTLNKLVADLQNKEYRFLSVAPVVDPPMLKHAGPLLRANSFGMPGRPEYQIATFINACTDRSFREHTPEIVHLATPDLFSMQVQHWATTRGIPVACTYHTRLNAYLPYFFGKTLAKPTNYLMWMWLRKFYNGCTHVYPPTEGVATELVTNGVTAPMLIWPRGVDLTSFNRGFRSNELRQSWGVKEGEIVVLIVCRMVWEKNLRIFIDAMKGLLSKRLPIQIVVVGDGPALPKMKLNLPSASFAGSLRGRKLANAYASADMFFFPSTTETFGRVTLEALASGLTVVTAAGPGGDALIRHNVTGWKCDVSDVSSTVTDLAMLINSPKMRLRLGAGAEKALESHNMDWPFVIGMMEDYYDVLLKPIAGAGANGMVAMQSRHEVMEIVARRKAEREGGPARVLGGLKSAHSSALVMSADHMAGGSLVASSSLEPEKVAHP